MDIRGEVGDIWQYVFQSDQSMAKTQKTHEPKFVGFLIILGRPCGIRTCDQRIKSPLLYQLS
jgi:hypothetical protein